MTVPGRSRRDGVFAGLPRAAYARWPRTYVAACAAGVVLHGLAVAMFGAGVLLLFVDLTPSELAAFGLCLGACYAVEGVLAAARLRRVARPVRAWLSDERRLTSESQRLRDVWSSAAGLPDALLRSRALAVLGVVGAVGASVVLAGLLGLPLGDAVLALPLAGLLYLSSIVLRYVGLELALRPVLEDVGSVLAEPDLAASRVSLHQRLVAAVLTVTWASGAIVGGLLTHDSRGLRPIGSASVVALGVAVVISTWLSLVLADAVSGPVVNLRDATRAVAAGDLTVRVPVVSMDETGELAESFNAMVAGLDERERLREAFGAFVDPALTERVLAEGGDLAGEEVDVSVLFLDARDFTAFAESVPAREVVEALNALYELVVPVVVGHGGHPNRFLGDGLLAVFGAPERQDDHAVRAVDAALEMIGAVGARPDLRLRIGIGISSGRVVAGTIGGGGRHDFTVIGDPVNTAARVEAATRDTGDDLLITEATLRGLDIARRTGFVPRPAAPLKGKADPVHLYAPRA